MPTYMYKAMTKAGVVVRNRVEFASKQNLIKTLKSNDLLPISIEQISYSSKKTHKRKKKNITDIQEIMKNVNTTQLNKEKKGKDDYITLDRAILIFFKKWKESNYNLEDLNRSIMYCLVELRWYRKKFKKQDFSCKM